MKEHCCEAMVGQVSYRCPDHLSPFSCPDNLIHYSAMFDEYGLIIHDSLDPDGEAGSVELIRFCPWCGKELPISKRDRWFSELKKLGYEDPIRDEIPEKFRTDEWYLGK